MNNDHIHHTSQALPAASPLIIPADPQRNTTIPQYHNTTIPQHHNINTEDNSLRPPLVLGRHLKADVTVVTPDTSTRYTSSTHWSYVMSIVDHPILLIHDNPINFVEKSHVFLLNVPCSWTATTSTRTSSKEVSSYTIIITPKHEYFSHEHA